ncbi:unnamed protein product [Amoebophrya sp. A25]|nr:unnamed protein product [Amoebophrya sp. A25]|eukprot:GSA25T00005345001.1
MPLIASVSLSIIMHIVWKFSKLLSTERKQSAQAGRWHTETPKAHRLTMRAACRLPVIVIPTNYTGALTLPAHDDAQRTSQAYALQAFSPCPRPRRLRCQRQADKHKPDP